MANSPQQLAIDAQHVKRQFDRRGDLSDAEFLYGEVAARMLERLKLIRLTPEVVLDAGCGNGRRFALLKQRYPDAHLIGVDQSQHLLSQAQSSLQSTANQTAPWWKRLLTSKETHRPTELVAADLASTNISPESIDLIWSNLAIHWHPAPHDVLREWSRLLRPDGLAFFTCWGPGTAQELRQALVRADLTTQTLPLVDMHDLGDLMVEQGFADPVMDQETLTLTYDHAEALLADARALGGNPNPARKASLASRQWRKRLLHALEAGRAPDGKLRLTLEVAYGHAWRGALRRDAGETRISLQSITRKQKDG